jgi:hypothetical protein
MLQANSQVLCGIDELARPTSVGKAWLSNMCRYLNIRVSMSNFGSSRFVGFDGYPACCKSRAWSVVDTGFASALHGIDERVYPTHDLLRSPFLLFMSCCARLTSVSSHPVLRFDFRLSRWFGVKPTSSGSRCRLGGLLIRPFEMCVRLRTPVKMYPNIMIVSSSTPSGWLCFSRGTGLLFRVTDFVGQLFSRGFWFDKRLLCCLPNR